MMSDAMSSGTVARYWWAVALRGVAALIFGILAFLLPAATLATLVILLAAYLIADAIFSIIASVRAIGQHQRWWSLMLEALLDLVAGVLVLVWPGLTALALVWVMAVWAIFTGVTGLIASTILPWGHGRFWEGLSALISIALGIVMIALPVVGALAAVYWIAFYAILFGILQLVFALRLHGRWRAGTTVTA